MSRKVLSCICGSHHISIGQWLEPEMSMKHGELTLCSPPSSNNVGIKGKSFKSHNFH